MTTYQETIQSIKEHLSTGQKRKMVWLAGLIFVQGVLDVFGLGLILPIIKIASDPLVVADNKYYMGDIYHWLGFTSVNTFILFIVLSVLVFYILKTIFGLFVSWILARYTTEVAIYITKNQYDKYYSLSYTDFTNIKSSIITMHVFINPSSYMAWIINPLIIIFSEGVIVLIMVISIILFNFTLFMCILATVGPATWLIYYSLKNKSSVHGRELDKVIPKVYASLNNSVYGYTDVKLAGKENDFRQEYMEHVSKYHDLTQKSAFLGLVPMRGYEIVAMLGIVVIFVYILFISASNISSAVLLVGLFAAAAYRLMPSMNRIVGNLMYIKRSQSSVANLNYYKEAIPGRKPVIEDLPIEFNHTIEFKNISYRFPGEGQYVLKNINLNIKKGEKVGFVGPSGSGKTTLINLLLRFIEEESGEILVDGVKLNDNNLRNWRRHIGYVKQDIFILDGSIKENIAFGDSEVNEERLWRAVTQASLSDLVKSLPDGVNSEVGEKGSRLSGGQRQRIGIARALYRDAEILVFDEATSALDNETEAEVTEAIDKLSDTNKTIFVIAHRITTLKNCNRIYELKNGTIGGVHSYEELLERIM
ncbi:MAG: ABC transporter ATP-binding protein [Bacteroidia bacterium]